MPVISYKKTRMKKYLVQQKYNEVGYQYCSI